jgi:terminal uridylyltransferase
MKVDAAHVAGRLRTATKGGGQQKKLQHFLVMKAFNLRKGNKTLTQQLQFLKCHDPITDDFYLDVHELCDYLQVPPFRKIVLFQLFHIQANGQVHFNDFVSFLQNTATNAAAMEEQNTKELPIPPPPSCLTGEFALTIFHSNPNQKLMGRAPQGGGPPPAPGLWKKREIVIQERIVEYTKIDDQGKSHHLVEKEKHQTEVIHMESLEGEFAHREITHFEQLEQLNDEVVHHDQGKEEFFHLKSLHDEISHFESSMPPKHEECEQAPPSPSIKNSSTEGRHTFDFTCAHAHQQHEKEQQQEQQHLEDEGTDIHYYNEGGFVYDAAAEDFQPADGQYYHDDSNQQQYVYTEDEYRAYHEAYYQLHHDHQEQHSYTNDRAAVGASIFEDSCYHHY